METIGKVVDDTKLGENGTILKLVKNYFHPFYLKISDAKPEVVVMNPYIFCYVQKLKKLKSEKENQKKTIWTFIYELLPPNIFAMDYFEKKETNKSIDRYTYNNLKDDLDDESYEELPKVKDEALDLLDEEVLDCRFSIFYFELPHNGRIYKYDRKNRYANLLKSYELAIVLDSKEGPESDAVKLKMDVYVKAYFDLHVQQLKDNINTMKEFTISALCKSNFAEKNEQDEVVDLS